MIMSFGDKMTEDLYHGRQTSRVRKLPSSIIDGALIKLDMLEAASELLDLRSPPGNRLEILKGNYQGFYSIRVNLQWRLIFKWQGSDARKVRLIDYH